MLQAFIFYCIMSYLFLYGIKSKYQHIKSFNLLFAPITLPIIAGQLFVSIFDVLQDIKKQLNSK